MQARLFTAGSYGLMAQWHTAPGSFSLETAMAALAGNGGPGTDETGAIQNEGSRPMSHDHTQAGAPPVRASDAEREQAAEILRTGYAEGRLSHVELDERLAAAYAAMTRADPHDLTSDLPGAVAAPPARDRPAPAALPILDRESGTGTGPNWCLLLCLLCAFPPAGIVYWILTARRQSQLRPPAARDLLSSGDYCGGDLLRPGTLTRLRRLRKGGAC